MPAIRAVGVVLLGEEETTVGEKQPSTPLHRSSPETRCLGTVAACREQQPPRMGALSATVAAVQGSSNRRRHRWLNRGAAGRA
uniref:Uncharacterized protein n=1 Tax=Oryza brachyantha TaxID=4533 RepID=J3N0T5_ORYBR